MSVVEGWTTVQLGSVIKDIGDGGTPNTNKREYFGGAIPWVVIQDIRKDISTTKTTLTPLGLKSCSAKLWPAGSVILSTGATIGEVGLAAVPVATKQGIHGIVCKEELSSQYLYYKLQTLRGFLNANAQGSTIREVRATFLRTIPFLFPISKSEQTKIAEILSTVDRAIEQTEALIAKQQRIKTGLMQDLLTRGIDEQGNLRTEQTHKFKDSPLGRIPVEWEVKRIGDVFEIQLGKMLSQIATEGHSPFYYLGNKNVQWDHVGISDLQMMDFDERERQKYNLRQDDILVCEGGEVGRTAIWRNEVENCYFQKAIHRLRPIDNQYLPGLFPRFMKWAIREGLLSDYTSQTSIAHLTQEKLATVPIMIQSLPEQSRLNSTLDQLDNYLLSQSAFLTKLHSLKAALMQDLLTGKRRFTTLLDNKE